MEVATFAVPVSLRPSPLQRHPGAAAAAREPLPTARAQAPTRNAAGAVATVAAVAVLAAAQRRRPARPSRSRSSRISVAATDVAEPPVSVKVAPEKVEAAKTLFSDVLGVRVPSQLDIFFAVLQGTGYTVFAKDEWRKIRGDLHPFLLPMAYRGGLEEDDEDLEVIGLLIRTPNGAALAPDQYQVVNQFARKSFKMTLLSLDIMKYIAKRSEEANFRNSKMDQPVIEATKVSYEVKFQGSDSVALDKWLLLEVGAFPDVYKNLALNHLEAGDHKTGLVIADTMRDAFGTQWGFPHAFVTRVLRDNSDNFAFKDAQGEMQTRDLEADHSAQRCFQTAYPLWTLEEGGDSIEKLLTEAKMPRLSNRDDLRVFYLKRAADDQRAAVRTGNISLGCAAVAKAQALMDAVCVGHKSFNTIRQELTELYDEVPGCEPLMEMIAYFKQDE